MRRTPFPMAQRHTSQSAQTFPSRPTSAHTSPRDSMDTIKSPQFSGLCRRGTRLWLIALVLTLFVLHRVPVFAESPPSHFDSADPLTGVNPPVHQALSSQQKPVRATDAAAGRSSPTGEANIAYFIQIAESTVQHLPRLLRKLYHERNVYAIHFDLKIPPDVLRTAERSIRSNPRYASNVHIMPSELITYRGVSMLLNTINAMRLLIDEDKSWDYFINLSGSDYPLITADLQRKLLGEEKGLNFFTFAPRRTWDSMAENRLAEVWFDESLTFRRKATIGKLSKLDVRNPIVDDREFEVSHAEAWMITSREFCDFVVRGDMARKMLVAFAYAVDSSEHFFASLAWNHEKYKKTIVPHSLRMIVWMHKGVLSGQHPYFIDEQSEEGEFKFKEELSTSVLFFARKFQDTDSKLMDYIDRRANEKDTIEKVATHLTNKIASRDVRVAEL